MKVKLFWVRSPDRDKGSVTTNHRGDNALAFEAQVNEWLAQHPNIEIAQIKQSACGGSWGAALWLVSVWYSERSGA